MARPLSEKKREAILKSAAEMVATLGTGAPTAKIAKGAGVAEGTLFTYFANKDDLLNQLFLEIEADLAKAMLEAYPADGDPRERTRHLWDRLIGWGSAHPMELKAIRQLKVSDRLSEENRRRGDAFFAEAVARLKENLAGHIDPERAPFYIGTVLNGLADMTIEAITARPGEREQLKEAGFDLFWKGIAR